MIAVRNPHAVQRLAHRTLSVAVAAHEPDHLLRSPELTAEERAADALLSLECRARYTAQHAATLAGAPAALPPRPALAPIVERRA